MCHQACSQHCGRRECWWWAGVSEHLALVPKGWAAGALAVLETGQCFQGRRGAEWVEEGRTGLFGGWDPQWLPLPDLMPLLGPSSPTWGRSSLHQRNSHFATAAPMGTGQLRIGLLISYTKTCISFYKVSLSEEVC